MLSSTLQFVAGSMKINGVSNVGNISNAINIGTLATSQTAVVPFEAMVLDIQTGGEAIKNRAVVEYNYQKSPTSLVENGSDESNENSIAGFDTTIEKSKHISAETVQVGIPIGALGVGETFTIVLIL